MEETNMAYTAVKISDYISRPELKAYVKKGILKYHESIQNIVVPSGCKLKRTPEDYLIDKCMFNPADLISEFNLILEKKSSLPSSVRKVVTNYVVQAIFNLQASDLRKAKEESENGNKEESRG